MKKNIALILSEDCIFPSDYQEVLMDNIEEIADHSCDNLYIGDILDYYPTSEFKNILDIISKKVRVEDGCVHIKSPDLLQACWYASKMNLDVNKLRYILYETNRKTCYTLDEMVELLNTVEEITILSASYINGYEYQITFNRYEEKD